MKYLFTLIMMISLVSACGSSYDTVSSSSSTETSTIKDDTTDESTPVTDTNDSCITSMQCQTLILINEIRSSNNLGTLTTNTACQRAAQAHAEDMAQNNYFSHTSQNGTTAGDRVRAVGGIFVAENIAYGQTTAQLVTTAWMNSAGHKRNILLSRAITTGIGYSKDNQGRAYWVQNFCGE